MDRFGPRKILPIISMLGGILVVGIFMPGTPRVVSRSLGETVPTRLAMNTRDDASGPSGQVTHPPVRGNAGEKDTISAPSRIVTASVGTIGSPVQAPPGVLTIIAGERSTVVPFCDATGVIDRHRARRIRVASRVPAAMPMVGLPKSPVVPLPEFVAPWPLASSLVEQLARLKDDDLAGDLAQKCIDQLERLHMIESLDATDCPDTLDQLRWLAENAATLAKMNPASKSGMALHRIAYAVQRRLAIWEQIHLIARQSYEVSTSTQQGDFTPILDAVEAELRPFKSRAAWRTFLMLDDARQAFIGEVASASDRRELAQQILRRMASPKLTDRQRQFFQRAAIRSFRTKLESWTSEPVDYASIMRRLEEYESDERGLGGNSIAAAQQALLLSPNADAKELARRIDVHYRNANLRVAVSGELINRLLPKEQQMREHVRDRILGADVNGVSQATNRLRIRLLPDRQRWRLGIESRGEGNSQTAAERGPVVFENQGRFRINVRKVLLVDRRGVSTSQSEAEADSDNEVTSIATNYDNVPLLGAVVRSIALNQQAQSRHVAAAEVNRRLEALARRRMDEEVQARLDRAEKEFSKGWIAPIRRLGLNPTPIEMQTTSKRLIARYRLASTDQLAAFTPRPMALSSSWLSLQIHESALNNVVRQFGLDGRTMELRELYEHIGQKLGRAPADIPEDVPDNVTIRFADHDSVTVGFKDRAIRVTLRIAKLSAGQKSWRGFTVQVNYIVKLDGLDIRATRDASPDDYIAVQGIRRLGNRIAIATIFSKVFSHERQFPILPAGLANDRRLGDLAVGQLVLDKGWLGVSIVPNPADEGVVEQARRIRRFFR